MSHQISNTKVVSTSTPSTTSMRSSNMDKKTTDSLFYEVFKTTYSQNISSLNSSETGTKATALQTLFGTTERINRSSNVSIDNQARFAAILNKAYSSDAMNAPEAFLRSLSEQEIETLRINHNLAEQINVENLSREGASNLLMPNGHSQDLNNDGIDEIGAAHTMTFPPHDAPTEFIAKWNELTAEMNPSDKMRYEFEMHTALYGIHLDGQPEHQTPSTNLIETYRSAIQNLLENIEVSKPFNTQEWYDHTKEFYSELKQRMA